MWPALLERIMNDFGDRPRNVCLKSNAPVLVVLVVENNAEPSQVNRNIASVACHEDYRLPNRMRKPQFVKYIGVSSREISDRKDGFLQDPPDVGHDGRAKNSITSDWIESGTLNRVDEYVAVVPIKLRRERHHHKTRFEPPAQ